MKITAPDFRRKALFWHLPQHSPRVLTRTPAVASFRSRYELRPEL